MSERNIINELAGQSPNRRRFVQKLGLAGAALGTVAATRGIAQSTAPSDADILNFALNLEYLEAEFYTYAVTGAGIAQAGLTVTGSVGASGPTTGGARVNFTDRATKAVAIELAHDEETHVTLLQSAIAGLGAQAIAKPAINLDALGFGFGNMYEFLKLARIFEDIGVTAYGYAAPLISNTTILGYAARILATEAAHSGNIRYQIARFDIDTLPPLDGADHLPPPSGAQFFPTDSNAITEVRSPGQVLYLAYAGPNATSGGFFPSGVNGTLNTSSATPATTDGAYLTADPNPVPPHTSTTITWSAPSAQAIEIRVGAPDGPQFASGGSTGSMATGNWFPHVTFYLQDVTGGKPLTFTNTLATLVITGQR